ncbi:unnamed protein product [Cyclocybe aegerita]|uniref:MARVEL domain-containing protein n=1 Tax=Cyclocybe aegerita TaxID=1973307 RepID=A0A8S0X1B8_CYCAE|nr:unnamed protein product [Cyclocybe aegerita]
MGLDNVIREGHPSEHHPPSILDILILFSIIELAISAWLTSQYNSHHNFSSGTLRARVTYTLFVSVWTIVLSSAFLGLFLVRAGNVLVSVMGHFVFLFVTWILWLAASAALTDTLGGTINCATQSVFVHCGQLNALLVFAWLICFGYWFGFGFDTSIGTKPHRPFPLKFTPISPSYVHGEVGAPNGTPEGGGEGKNEREGKNLLNTPHSPEISPVTTLFTTNYPPNPQEEAIARQLIASSEAQIARVDRLIDQVSDILEDLYFRRAEYEHHAYRHRNIISSIRRIPSEILVEIFLQAVTNGDPNDIWALVELSCSAPLNLSIFRGRSSPVYPLQVLISPHSERITHLTVCDLLQSSRSTLFCSSSPMLWDALRSLELQFPYAESLEALQITVFQHAPLLQDVNLNFTDRRNPVTSISKLLLPWSQLRKLSTSKFTLNCVFTILREASVLEECYLDLTELPMPSNIPHLSHQSLTTLHVSLWYGEDTHEPFNRLTLPSLRKLSVDGCDLDIVIICTLIERSSCRLTFLNFPTANPVVTNDTLRLFSLLPDATDLCIPFSLVSFEQIGAMSPSTLLPQLRHLSLKVTVNSRETPDMLALRSIAYTNVPPLETIIFTTERRHLEELIPSSPHDEDSQIQILQRWDYQLEELSCSDDGIGAVKEDSVFLRDLDRILSLMITESETGTSGEHLCHETGRSVFSRLRGLLEQAPDSLCLRISAILALWSARIREYLTSIGWMENLMANVVVYTRRQGFYGYLTLYSSN